MIIKVDTRRKGLMFLTNVLRTVAIAIVFSAAHAADPSLVLWVLLPEL
jgi:hypothetical protein